MSDPFVWSTWFLKPSGDHSDYVKVDYTVVDRVFSYLGATHQEGKPYEGSAKEQAYWREHIEETHIHEDEES